MFLNGKIFFSEIATSGVILDRVQDKLVVADLWQEIPGSPHFRFFNLAEIFDGNEIGVNHKIIALPELEKWIDETKPSKEYIQKALQLLKCLVHRGYISLSLREQDLWNSLVERLNIMHLK